MHWQKVAILGVGLLGGSLGLAAQKRRLADEVCGYVRRKESLADCANYGVVTRATNDIRDAVQNADLVILCTPIAQMHALAEQMLPALKKQALVTDVGSVKGSVVEALEPLINRAHARFVGSHPMAGAETMGMRAARPDLFERAVCVVTPTSRTAPEAVKAIEEFWTSVGARTMRLTPARHDEFVSRSSHLPHVVAAELANYVLSPAHPKEQARLCANGFRDTTRVASGSPEMWRDIALANAENLARVVGVFVADLKEFQLALEKKDEKTVQEFFELAKQRRDQWCTPNASTSPE